MLKFPRNKYSNTQQSRYREVEQEVVEAIVNGGMVTSIDPADIKNNQFVLAKNFVVRFDKLSRRFGSVEYPVTKPDSDKILAIVPFKRFSESQTVIRFTESGVEVSDGLNFQTAVGVLTGDTNDRFRFTTIEDRFFFANGVDYIQELDADALTFARAGNAPAYKYITSFNNRVLGAYNYNGGSPIPTEIGWSGNLNYTEYSALVDRSAGFTQLVDSPTDFADAITGIFGFTETALLLRERSLWGINKQPSSTNPFTFFVISPGIGCDTPHSATGVKSGVCWFDNRTGAIYFYKLGMAEPEDIGSPIRQAILDQIENPLTIFASYNPIEDEYTLCIPSSITTVVAMWTYNFRAKTWCYEQQNNISAIANIDYSTGSILIDSLLGTIDSLIGVINDLGRSVAFPTRVYGNITGDILLESSLADDDNGTIFNSELISKIFAKPRTGIYWQTLVLQFIIRKGGEFTLYYTKDDGETWHEYKTVTLLDADIGKRKTITCRKQVRANEFAWGLDADSGLFDIIKYELHPTESQGQTRSN